MATARVCNPKAASVPRFSAAARCFSSFFFDKGLTVLFLVMGWATSPVSLGAPSSLALALIVRASVDDASTRRRATLQTLAVSIQCLFFLQILCHGHDAFGGSARTQRHSQPELDNRDADYLTLSIEGRQFDRRRAVDAMQNAGLQPAGRRGIAKALEARDA